MDELDKNIIEQVVRIISESLQENGWAQQAKVCLKCQKAGINTKVLGSTSYFFAAMEDYVEKDIDNNGLPILRLRKCCPNPYIKTYLEIGELNKGWRNFDKYVKILISSGIANDEDEIKKERVSCISPWMPTTCLTKNPAQAEHEEGYVCNAPQLRPESFHLRIDGFC